MAFTPTLYTPRLTLRPFSLADAPRVRELAGDPLVAATTAHIPHPYPAGLAEDLIRSHGHLAQDNRQFHFAITLTGTRTPGRENDLADTGHLIGNVSLMLSSHLELHRAELGYWIGVPYWRRGFATEAAHATLKFGFTRKQLRLITARCVTSNTASSSVLEKLGMIHDACLPEDLPQGHRRHEVESFALTLEQWQSTRPRRFSAAPALIES